MIDVLKADIEKFAAEAARLAEEIEDHEIDISEWQADIEQAEKIREADKADYQRAHADVSESITATESVVATMKSTDQDVKQAFLQLSNLRSLSDVPDDAKRTIESFLSMEQRDADDLAAPEANAYEFQSGGIVQVVEEILDKFVNKRTKIEKGEMSSKQAFEMAKLDLNAQIEQATADKDEKAEAKAKNLQDKATAEGDLQDTTATRDDDKKYLTDLTTLCAEKASAFEQRQQLRAEEIEAIEKAISIISDGAVAGAADKHLPALLQKSSFAQLRSDAASPTQARVSAYLQDKATKLHSRVLAAIAVRVSADPFVKVKKMIKDLIIKLQEEANDEAEHKGWCDTELSTNEQTRNEKTAAVETLIAEIDELNASISKLSEDITDLTTAVADLDAAMAKASDLRAAEKAKNAETVADAKAAQQAVAQALTVLKEFYEKAGEATAFVQQKHKQMPEIFDDKPYQGMGGASGGVVGMLEVIESDFARLEADTSAAEETAQTEYDGFMTDSKTDKTQKMTDIDHKTSKKQDQTQTLAVKNEDKASTQNELDAALAYFDKLKPTCISTGQSYEDRVARREEEVQSLTEALKILNGESI
jgi:hypothetical protein